MTGFRDPPRALLRAPELQPGIVAPRDLPRSSASGPLPHHVLTVGGELLTGYGVDSHELGVPGNLARQLTASTGLGIDVELTVAESTAVDRLERLLFRTRLDDLDALVLVLDAADQVRRLPDLPSRLGRLLLSLTLRMPAHAAITVAVGGPLPQALTGRRVRCGPAAADEVAVAVREAVAQVPGAAFVGLPVLPALGPADVAQAYGAWGALLGAMVAPRLRHPTDHRSRLERIDEAGRRAAVGRLGVLDGEWETGFRRVVEFARIAYGTSYAALSVVGGAGIRVVARRDGSGAEEAVRIDALAETALHYRGGLVIGDARPDPRFRDDESVRSGAVRFYAGHRVRSPEGQPVASICVFDPEPRLLTGGEEVVLRDFAVAIERRIWESLHGRRRR